MSFPMSQSDPELTPEQEARIASLLRQARVEESTPPDVVERLDATMARLAAERGASEGPAGAEVVSLAGRRRRRRATLLLGAAAAVVVGAIGLGTVLNDRPGDQDSGSATSADEPRATESDSEADSSQDEAPGSPEGTYGAVPPGAVSPSRVPTPIPEEPIQLETANFARQAARLQSVNGVESRAGLLVSDADLTDDPSFVCAPAAYGAGTLIAVYYDDRPAVLAFRPSQGGTQVVEVLRCGNSSDVLRSTTVSTR